MLPCCVHEDFEALAFGPPATLMEIKEGGIFGIRNHSKRYPDRALVDMHTAGRSGLFSPGE
jgi:hypothetical protein